MAFGVDDAANIGLGIANTIINSQNADRKYALDKQQFELSKDSYYNGITRKVVDAKNAGLHPLAALGMQGASYSPVIQNDTPDNSLAELGQQVRQSADSILQARMAKKESTLLDKQIEAQDIANQGAKLDNLIKSQNIGFSGEYFKWLPNPNAQGRYYPTFTEAGQPYSQLHSEADGIPQTYNQFKLYRGMYDALDAQRRYMPSDLNMNWDMALRMPYLSKDKVSGSPVLTQKDIARIESLIKDMVRQGLSQTEILDNIRFIGKSMYNNTQNQGGFFNMIGDSFKKSGSMFADWFFGPSPYRKKDK